jgi:hypothetical protein
MTRPLGRAIAIAVAAFSTSCWPISPSRTASLAGGWSGVSAPGKVAVTMCLEQRGSTISGTATGVFAGVVYFENAPASGKYPRVQFLVTSQTAGPCCPSIAGSSYVGEFDEDTGAIEGSWGTARLDLTRAPSGCGQ